ncbi:protein FAM83D-like [Sinocyclocheilus anshuiensis]|uniref:Protein FAM83D-like n=1 Tax=Sinocyclocheilus anshuiensis TaxID=1608454 RepID=A0A671QZH3_9TELE|nr:PREDICTED: protein FAM83D-like [Sinocyclocheilus anshuiensis]
MALSQCLEDSPGWRTPRTGQDLNLKELYNERHRLALEELVAGGVEAFTGFLQRERIPNFLSDDEIRRISRAAVVRKSLSLNGDDSHLDQSGTLDCSSVTYFPEVSDIEPPVLEMGWPAFTAGSFRGVTRAVAYFQPSYGECIYSCKEAARRMITNAKEVIAIVTDSLTDLDIFQDLQEACTRRRVPVYILLDQSSVPSFLQMCKNLRVQLDELLQMKVRSITGSTYYMRSGARITGKVHERFMLIDGNRVATGSYRFNWTDGKLNSSNLIELSGQITEKFDEEFRILYAQSLPLPVNTRAPSSARSSGLYDHLVLKPPGTPPSYLARTTKPQPECLTSTPARLHTPEIQQMNKDTEDRDRKSNPVSDTSTLGEDWIEQELREEALTSDDPRLPATNVTTQTVDVMISPPVPSCDISTQTTCQTADVSMQTCADNSKLKSKTSSSSNQINPNTSSACNLQEVDCHPPVCLAPQEVNLRECFLKITKERQHHYSSIRSKLVHMVTLLSHKRELVDLTNLTLRPGLHRGRKGQQEGRQGYSTLDNVIMGTWPRSRCLQ